jgi:hypothetical protein
LLSRCFDDCLLDILLRDIKLKLFFYFTLVEPECRTI